MRALLACSSPRRPNLKGLRIRSQQHLSDGPTPSRRPRLCLETSFTSLQSPLTDNYPQIGRELSVDSRGLPWEYVSMASSILASTPVRPDFFKAHPSEWSSCMGRLAPLATPETMSEASANSSPPSPLPTCHRPMMKRTPKISGNLSTAADDLKNNLHFAMLTAKNPYLVESGSSSEASYGSARSLTQGPPPPVPKRRDSVLISSHREHRVCTAACCRDDISENSSPHCSTPQSIRISHRVQIDFPDEEAHSSSLEYYEPKPTTLPVEVPAGSSDVFLSIRSSPECKGLMAPATDLGAEWRRTSKLDPGASGSCSSDASLPLLRGLSPTPQHLGASGASSNSPFFNAKRKKYVYPITMVSRGESSV